MSKLLCGTFLLHLCMHLYILSTFVTESTYVTWQLKTEVIRIGQPMELICEVHGVDTIDQYLIRQWSKESNLITFNGKVSDKTKYLERLQTGNSFSLIVNNVTQDDINCVYQCRYSFDVTSKKLQVTDKNFENPTQERLIGELFHNYTTGGNLSISLSVNNVFPIPKCDLLIGNEYKTFQLEHYEKYGLFYHVVMVYQYRNEQGCSTFQVYCRLASNKRIHVNTITANTIGVCPETVKTGETVILGTLITVGIFMLIFIIMVVHIVRRRKAVNKKGCLKPVITDSDYEHDQKLQVNKETCKNCNEHITNVTDCSEQCLLKQV